MTKWKTPHGPVWITMLLAIFIALSSESGQCDPGTERERPASLPWNLPAQITDGTTHIRFEVDSTWHLVKGATKQAAGRVWLETPSDYHSVRAEVSLPIAQFDTDNSDRDERMREVMHADKFPVVSFKLLNVEDLCEPSAVTIEHSCPIRLEGTLSMSGNERPFATPAVISAHEGGFRIRGESSFAWAEFGIEDPSILIAKLDPTVKVFFSIDLLPPGGAA